MEDNWSLSDRINTVPRLDGGEDIQLDIDVEDVREFIRLLKEEFKEGVNVHNVLNKIDKLAGSKLL